MARKGDALGGILIIIGLAIFIIYKIIVGIFEFIIENSETFLIIGTIFILIVIGIALYKWHLKNEEKLIQKIQMAHNFLERNLSLIKESKQKRLAILNKLDSAKDTNNDFKITEYVSVEVEGRQKTKNLKDSVVKLQNILQNLNIKTDNEIWDSFYDHSEFTVRNPNIYFLNKLSKISDIKAPNYLIEEKKYPKNQEVNEKVSKFYDSAMNQLSEKSEALIKKFLNKEKEWKDSKKQFYKNQNENNSKIDSLKIRYYQMEEEAITVFNKKLLGGLIYSKSFPISIDLEYNKDNKILIVEYLLPNLEHFSRIKEFRYIKTRNELKKIYLSEKELEKLFDETIYRITLRSIFELFSHDKIDAIESIIFNGWTNAINKATGKRINACINTIHCNKEDFLNINLSMVDPKQCFKNLKGISANKLVHLTPIKPIQKINKSDNRFIESKEIEINSYTNIAAMHWGDFEHLIREIFEKEFSTNGGEVKVTQSSRDGGVDAIAFDPDPIRGGKIIIQAKRYTNVVGLSAVRDLYGTVVNEGASKGILVTTANFGSDEFYKNKPLTLMNGNNLLYLLEKHGYKAKIDIVEAKKILNEDNT